MKIIKYPGGYFVRVSQKEAVALIKSLSGQIVQNNPNSERIESYCSISGDYFSISVTPDRGLND